jgi:hypothetical protein
MTQGFDPAQSDAISAAVSDGLRRLAERAPQPRPDRLAAVVAGARRRRQVHATTSVLTAAAFVVAAAVGVHTWRATSSNSPITPGHGLVSSATPSGPLGSSPPAAPAASPVTSPSLVPLPQPGAKPPSSTHTTGGGLSVSVTAPASVGDYTPATVVMKVTNKGSVATHGGSFDVLVGFTGDGGGIQYNGYSSTCQAVAGDVLCTVGTLAPGRSQSFSLSVIPQKSTTITFGVTWTYAAPGKSAVSTPYNRLVTVTPGLPSSMAPVPDSAPPGVIGSPAASSS